ncbi:MAG: ABC transporter permease [Pseudomonadota bacterium]
MTGALLRGLRNPFRHRARGALVVALLSIVVGLLALMIQAALVARQSVAQMEGKVRTLIELREAGAFGTGGFGKDKPVGEEHFTVETLEKVLRIPHLRHLTRVDEYVYHPQIDPSKKNAYAMVIGLRPGAALRAIGEIDYENARIVAGRSFTAKDASARVAIAGRLYARQRLGVDELSDAALAQRQVTLNGQAFQVIGVYATGNDFGDNHVFIPLEAFRATFNPGRKLSKIFVTVDSVAHVEPVVEDLRRLAPEADIVTTPEAVSTARVTLGSLALTSTYAAAALLATGAVLVVFVMALSMRERIQEIGTLKALGASNGEIVVQFVAEAAALSGLGSLGALIAAPFLARFLQWSMELPVAFDGQIVLSVLASALGLTVLGSLYPVIRAMGLSPVEAMRRP